MTYEYKEMVCRVRFIDGVPVQTYLSDVEIVRCKDCKFSSPNGVYGCRIKSFADDLDKRMYADDWCSYAERKED